MSWPLMRNNITPSDMSTLVQFLSQSEMPRLTNGPQVEAFEREFSDWLGVKYSIMVNSGASANLLTIQAAKARVPRAIEVIVPAITWVSDIAAVLHAGLTPVFVDVDPRTFGVNWDRVAENVRAETLCVFVTHCLGFNACPSGFPSFLPLIEDCCESLGAFAQGRKLGTFGFASNFSFYYAHHMSTIEGGMICTHDEEMYEACRMLRSHGMTREMKNESRRTKLESKADLCHREFIFAAAAYNARSTEINAVIGREQLKRVDANNGERAYNLRAWLDNLDPKRFRTDYQTYGASNYSLPLVLVQPDADLFRRVLGVLDSLGVEYRRGTAGGGNQLRQPYLQDIFGPEYHKLFPEAEHIHQFGLYVGNYPGLEHETIAGTARALNAL